MKKKNLSDPIEVELGVPYKDDALDYQLSYPFDIPACVRKANNVGNIYANAVWCLKCNTYVRSKNRHDYRSCSCGAISVDGGSWYLRRSGDLTAARDMSLLYKDAKLEELSYD